MERFWKSLANLVGLIALVLLAWWLITLIPECGTGWICNVSGLTGMDDLPKNA